MISVVGGPRIQGGWLPPPVGDHEKAATGIKRIVMGSCSPLVFLPLVTYPSSLFLARISHHAGTLFGGLPEGRGFIDTGKSNVLSRFSGIGLSLREGKSRWDITYAATNKAPPFQTRGEKIGLGARWLKTDS